MVNYLIVLALVALMSFLVVGCNRKTDSKKSNSIKTEAKATDTQTEENKNRYLKDKELGMEYILPELWNKNKDNVDSLGLEISKTTEQNLLYGGMIYDFMTTKNLNLIKEEAPKIKDEEKSKKFFMDIFAQNKKLANIMVFDKEALEKAKEKGKKI